MTLSEISAASPYRSLDDYVALPRVEGVALSPDGAHAVLTVATPSRDATAYERSLWRVATNGESTPVRLTRSGTGETSAAFTADGDLLFLSRRPVAGPGDDDAPAQLWLLPAAGGEARPVTALAGGVDAIAATASEASTVVLATSMLPSTRTWEEDAALRAERAKRKVRAILHSTYPVRYWDHDLGPDEPHLAAVDLGTLAGEPTLTHPAGDDDALGEGGGSGDDAETPTPYPAHLPRPVDLTPHPGRSYDSAGQALSPDGRTLVVSRRRPEGRSHRFALVAIDVLTGAERTLIDEESVDIESPTISNDGRLVAFVRSALPTPQGPADAELWVCDLEGGAPRRLAESWDRWAAELHFDHDDRALVVTADHDGRAPVFRVPLDGGEVQRVTSDDYAYTQVRVIRGGGADGSLVALRSDWLEPPHPVRIAPDGSTVRLSTPATVPAPIARRVEVETVADDGTRVRAWLLLPEDAGVDDPAPLLLWIHGGPVNSWNAWSWRWCPQLAVARGYAVLLPDPGLSTGYGLDFIARGWNAWGQEPYTDLMAITDAAEERPEIDAGRTAAMGGSFGGYMANWVAGHTDRFDAIVTHASLWALEPFSATTDGADYWQRIFDEQGMAENSPHRFVADITTPMLVIHGDRDYRVPIGEGLHLWADLADHHAAPDGTMPHRYLYYPDENHWILKPQHAIVWYETVFAFLEQHVLGGEWERPRMLG